MDITEFAEFVKARLDEDEAAANAGARRVGMPWRAEPQSGTPGGLVIDELGLVGSTGGRYAAEHIARHDPARALREVAAKRAILAEHVQVVPGSGPYTGEPCCGACGAVRDDVYLVTRHPCDTVRAIAAVYSDHPDYRAEWTPEP